MPAVVTEASVARAPSQSSPAGGRQQGGADTSSPFSELLDSCDPAPTDAPGVAAAEKPRSEEAAPPDGKADAKADPANIPADQERVHAQAELLQAIAAATALPVRAEGKTEPTPAKVPGTESEEALSDADIPALPKDADAMDTTAVNPPPVPAATVPAAIAVPAPAPLPVPPVAENAATTVTEAVPAVAPSVDAVATEAAPVLAKVELPTEETGEPTPEIPTGEKQTAKAEKPAAAAPAEPAPVRDDAAKAAPAPDHQDAKATAEPEKPPARAATAAKPLPADNDTPQPKDVANAASSSTSANSSLPTATVTQPAAAHAMPPPSHRFGASETVPVAGLAVEIAARAEAGNNRFEIRLDPPELGRIHVQLHIDGDGNVTSHLRVDRVETLDLLRREAPTLERALQDAGLKTADSGLQFSLRDQSFSQHDQSRDTPAMAQIVLPDENLVPAETQRHYGRLAGLGGGVDIRV